MATYSYNTSCLKIIEKDPSEPLLITDENKDLWQPQTLCKDDWYQVRGL
jgi:hypothetical protein